MKLSDKARKVISAVAPTIGAALGGPFGAMAGKVLGGLVGGDEKAVEDAIIAGDPDALAKVRIAEIEFKTRLEELGIERDKLNFDDTANARAREIAVRDRAPAALALFITLGFFGVLAYMLDNEIPKEGRDALLIMLGSLGTAWATVVGYYFGSSAGSARKTDEMAKMGRTT
jgi:hypothetical protein